MKAILGPCGLSVESIIKTREELIGKSRKDANVAIINGAIKGEFGEREVQTHHQSIRMSYLACAIIRTMEKHEAGSFRQDTSPTGWEGVAAMANEMLPDRGGNNNSFGGEDGFDDIAAFDDPANWGEWPEWTDENDSRSEIESNTYSPEVVYRALGKAKEIAKELLDEQSFRNMVDMGEFDESGADNALAVISKVNAISYEDWQGRITPIEEYEYGKPYAMILHAVRRRELYDPREIQDFYKYTSCSVVTQDNVKLYNGAGKFGYIYPAKQIVAADTGDMAANNLAQNTDEVLSFREVPLLKTFDDVIKNTGVSTGYGFVGDYNEAVVRGLPSGIFYYNEDDFKYAKELQKLSGGLSIAKLYDASRDGLTD